MNDYINGINSINGKNLFSIEGAGMTNEKWKSEVYEPYVDSWKIIKILQEAYNKPELFSKYIDEVQQYADKYAGNEFAELLRKQLLLNADDVISKMERGA